MQDELEQASPAGDIVFLPLWATLQQFYSIYSVGEKGWLSSQVIKSNESILHASKKGKTVSFGINKKYSIHA